MSTLPVLRSLLSDRLGPDVSAWLSEASQEIADSEDVNRFCALLSSVSRRVPRGLVEPTADELDAASDALEGWSPERWSLREAARVVLVLSRTDLARESGATAVQEAFRYADVGELCALYRSLAHLPAPERFLWQAQEGCRTNMTSVFEADVCDTPYPFHHFDDIAWRQALVKAVFIGAPLWRVWGLDRRLSPETARMALDLADERRSAGRAVQPDLWLCLGEHAGPRGLESLERELATAPEGNTAGRSAAAYALARAGEAGRLDALLEGEADARVADAMRDARAGRTDQGAWRALAELQTVS